MNFHIYISQWLIKQQANPEILLPWLHVSINKIAGLTCAESLKDAKLESR